MVWVPYQRETFVTPPFAGYTSGYSTFSRAGAEVLTAFTGDAYFPGGMGTFTAPANDYLEFEQGPSEDITQSEASSGPLAILGAILKLAARDRLVLCASRMSGVGRLQ